MEFLKSMASKKAKKIRYFMASSKANFL